MAIPIYKIGSFQFVSLDGEIALPYQHAETIQRPGVDGTGFIQTGKFGDEFELTTGVDVSTYANALILETSYKSICNSQIVNLIRNGYSYGAIQIGFVVRDVKVQRIQQLRQSVGGLVAGLAWVNARWRMHAVEI